ncbi:MAG: CobW family GTP-binding protein [Planctomycetota bacterium]
MTGVAADILTGWLGSGKTTLLRHVLAHGLDGRRIAVVMNELGEIGIDGKVLTGLPSVERMVELNSGCICCSVGAQFGMAIQDILRTLQPHLVILETTGVAEPEPLIQVVKESGLALDAVITVVDALNLEACLAQGPSARHQIEAADFLVLNKTDLVERSALRRAANRLRRFNPRAVLEATVHGRVENDLLFATSVGRARRLARMEKPGEGAASGRGHLEADRMQAFFHAGEPGECFERARFERFLARLPAEIYRAKGIVRLEGETRAWLFHFTCGRYDLEPFPEGMTSPATSQAVFLGRGAARHEARVLKHLARCRPAPPRLPRWLGEPGKGPAA